ncbi:Protein FAM204A [Merluccius polli]|uniref:Protein FAM204A n=1 Tax=Merluccius polli TaxID=89951 RepID=A0AA47N128_MERPO|nr:Protein FAM204A [Merluccius polli]
MYSGLLPKGLTESDLSSDDEEEQEEEERQPEEQRGGDVREDIGQTAAEVDSSQPQSQTDPQGPPPTDGLPGISQDVWQRFRGLQKRKDDLQTCPKVPRRRRRRNHKKGPDADESDDHQVGFEKQWDGLKQYFGVNDRFQPPASSNPALQSGLEKSMESAIAEGDIGRAEEMSDRLATREEEEASRAAQKRKTVAWGFEAKKRWETKSNMGYM